MLMDTIQYHMTHARHVNSEILALSDSLDPEVVRLIDDIGNYGYFEIFDTYMGMFRSGLLKHDESMSFIARNIFDYLQIVDHVDDYIQNYLPTTFARPSYLVSGSIRTSNVVPLRRYVRPEAATAGAILDFVAPNAESTDTTALQDDEQEQDDQQEPPAGR
jgi:hypothetical protein